MRTEAGLRYYHGALAGDKSVPFLGGACAGVKRDRATPASCKKLGGTARVISTIAICLTFFFC